MPLPPFSTLGPKRLIPALATLATLATFAAAAKAALSLLLLPLPLPLRGPLPVKLLYSLPAV
jgi:hypothetical protein